VVRADLTCADVLIVLQMINSALDGSRSATRDRLPGARA